MNSSLVAGTNTHPPKSTTSEKIPLVDLHRQFASIETEVREAMDRVLKACSFIGGTEKDQFEKEFAQAHNVPHCIGVANGTDSLFLILRALGIGPGDEVVTAANSFISSSETITACGASPVFADIEASTFNIDLEKLEELLHRRAHTRGGKIKGIIAVHLYGRLLDMPQLMKIANRYNVRVIEDTAQAHFAQLDGKRAGTFGDAGSFSFYPGKNLGAYGDAGAVICSDAKLAERIAKLANHGRARGAKYDHELEGYNSRLDTLQAAVLRVKLRHLAQWTSARQSNAKNYDQLLSSSANVIRPHLGVSGQHVFHLYVVRVDRRDQILAKLKTQGIEAGIHYPIILPMLPAYSRMGLKAENFPVASQLQQEILSLPMFPELTAAEQSRVVEVLLREVHTPNAGTRTVL